MRFCAIEGDSLTRFTHLYRQCGLTRKSVSIAVVACLFACVPQAAWAWGADGHRLICTVASYEMDEAARGQVKRLLKLDTREAFAEVCVGPDEPEHAIYVPPEAHEIDRACDCGGPGGCALTVVDESLAILKAEGDGVSKAQALGRLMRAVGDLHEPLNVGFSADRGGRDISAVFRGQTTSLRAIWDDGLLEARPESWREIADSYAARFTYVERRTWPDGTPLQWANESLYIARTPATGYIGNPGGLDFGALYVRQNQLIALRRMTQAGVRLGQLLNRTFSMSDDGVVTSPLPGR